MNVHSVRFHSFSILRKSPVFQGSNNSCVNFGDAKQAGFRFLQPAFLIAATPLRILDL